LKQSKSLKEVRILVAVKLYFVKIVSKRQDTITLFVSGRRVYYISIIPGSMGAP